MRKLAHVERIEWLKPIDGADKIELAGVMGWQCIVKKSEFKVGDLCVYIEIDSIVDKNNPNFAFLEKRNWKIKTMKMRGVISQGIVFPLTILPKTGEGYNIGDDLTSTLKITHVEDDVPKETSSGTLESARQRYKKLFKNKFFQKFMRFRWFRKVVNKLLPRKKSLGFPDWIKKTDETRLQNMPQILEDFKDRPMIVTEKLDGTSTSFGLKKINKRRVDFAVCSRNQRQVKVTQKTYYESNFYHKIATKYDIEKVLRQLMDKYKATTVVLQGETIGEGIQKNKYGIKGLDFYAFNLIVDGERIDSAVAARVMKGYGIKWVPILEIDFRLLPTVNEMISFADGKSQIADTLREGVVIRDHGNTVSFKCISNKFLLKHNI